MNTDDSVLVKYCFSQPSHGVKDNKETYYTSIIKGLQAEGIIQNLQEYAIESPFGFEKDIIFYEIEPCEKYVFTFTCNEIRDRKTESFRFLIKFVYETHDTAEILYVEICSNDYTFNLESTSNCLEILKHKLRSKIKGWSNRYCLLDKQSAFYASSLYPRIYEIENFFRYYVNDVCIKVFGANWWNEAIAKSIKENRKNRIDDTREYAGAYKDIQPYLLSLELSDLMIIANTKKLKWIPSYNSKIENILNHYSDTDIITLLREQCQLTIDLWNMCFAKHLSTDFVFKYASFEKRRNQVAHNKLLDYENYKNIHALCDTILEELVIAHQKFCSEFISAEEQEMIEEYEADLAQQEELEREALNSIAEEESGVKVYSKREIIDLFNDTLHTLYQELIQIFDDRQDIDFASYNDIKDLIDKQLCFEIKYKIRPLNISINSELEINESQGETSVLTITCESDSKVCEYKINFINGEYSYNSGQTTYMPEMQDSLDDMSVEETKKNICDFIEDKFPNLREEADIQNHLDAMGKSSSITEKDVFCWDCGEEYICINDEYAPFGTCLNCGARNHIIYCTYCQCPVEAVDIEEKDEEQHYCPYCYDKLFRDD